MNISSIGGASGMTGVTGANQDDFRTRMQQAMAPVAQLFGMSSDDLMSAVKASGGSLADYAASKGISSSDLTAAIKQGLQANAPNGVQLSDSQLTNLAQRIENHKPGDRPARAAAGWRCGWCERDQHELDDQDGAGAAHRRPEGLGVDDVDGRHDVELDIDDQDRSRQAHRRSQDVGIAD